MPLEAIERYAGTSTPRPVAQCLRIVLTQAFDIACFEVVCFGCSHPFRHRGQLTVWKNVGRDESLRGFHRTTGQISDAMQEENTRRLEQTIHCLQILVEPAGEQPGPSLRTIERMSLSTAPAHHHLRVEIELRGHTFECVTTWGLFHPKGVDAGTRLLIDLIDVPTDADCLDLGCGWGPIGLCLTRLAPQGQVQLVDKDFVAIEFASHNLVANHCNNGRAFLSNGLHHVEATTSFDLIASNIPAKVGGELLDYWMAEMHQRLRPGGRLWVVTVAGLKDYVKRVFREHFGNYRKVKQSRTHIVAYAEREP